MKTKLGYLTLVLTALVIITLGVAALVVPSAKAAGTSYYVDCSAATNGSGTQSSPWNTISTVNSTTFQPGDSILFKRGATCSISVSLHPLGSGSAANPITLGAYGTGALPIIAGSSSITTIYMVNQQGWHIQDLEVTGGNQKAIQFDNTVSGQQLTHIRLTNLVVHNTLGNPSDAGASIIQVSAYGAGSGYFDDVIVDGVTAYNSNLWQGIQIIGGGIDGPANNNPGQIIVRNSTVYSSGGNGITVFRANNVTIENNVVHDNGNYNPGTAITQTPGGIWVWETNNTVAQFNEVYNQHTFSTAGYDGGGMDFDYAIANTTYQYNYLHDNDGYCMSFFGAFYTGMTTNTAVNDVARYNICSNNGRTTKSAFQGDYYFSTWSSGFIDGVQVYNNTSYWSPITAKPAVYDKASSFTGTRPRFFRNNIIYSTVANMVDVRDADVSFDYNIYWNVNGAGSWKFNKTSYSTIAAWRTGTGFDTHSIWANPLLNDPTYHAAGRPSTSFTLQTGSPAINAGVDVGSMGGRDFYGNAVPQGGAYDIGAVESGGAPAPTATPTNTATPVPPTITPGGPTNTPTNTPVNTPTVTNTPVVPTSTPGGAVEMHVADIYTTDINGTPKTTFIKGDIIYWRVLIVDQSGSPVSGATVATEMLKPDGSQQATRSGTTGSDGWVMLSQTSRNSWTSGTFSVRVTNVTKTGATYNSAANVKTSCTFVVQ